MKMKANVQSARPHGIALLAAMVIFMTAPVLPQAGGSTTSLVVMVQIPGGTFTMGSPTGEPNRNTDETQHPVTLTGFSMGKYPVTQEEYQKVMGSNPSYFHGGTRREPAAGETQVKRPVELVSWYDALVFCNKLSIQEGLSPAYSISGKTNPADWGAVPTSNNATWNAVIVVSGSKGYRLPTEAQWEYACRAGTTTAYNTGAAISDSTGWYDANSGNKTHQVGLKPPNAFGLYDMHGNVFEWCWDRIAAYSGGAQTDPSGPGSGAYRALRGGSFGDTAEDVRSAYRGPYEPNSRYHILGFRILRP
jgi:formylglycine-generating enzyme required for sulfatase activity